MSFINWGNETPEQREFRKRLEHQEFLERVMARKMFEARGANSAATSASAAAAAGAAGGGGSGSSGGLSLTLEFNSVEGAQEYVPNLTSVASWNNFFDLPTYGNPFTRVEVDEATISLYGGSDIIMKAALFINVNESLISVDDQGCVIELEDQVFGFQTRGDIYQFNLVSVNFPNVTTAGIRCFSLCTSLTNVSMPSLTAAGAFCFDSLPVTNINFPVLVTTGATCFRGCRSLEIANLPSLTIANDQLFEDCTALTSINLPAVTAVGATSFSYCESVTDIRLPSCTNLGGTVGNTVVFSGILGNTIQLTVPAALMTNNGGNPDGDIQYLQANNTVTVTQV